MSTSHKEPVIEPEYLGDSVYAKFDGFGVVLTTDSHEDKDAGNRIVLEPEVVSELVAYIDRIKAVNAAPGEEPAKYDKANVYIRQFLEMVKGHKTCAEMGMKNLDKVAHLLPKLSATATINPCGGSCWFTVDNREDVQLLLQLAPRWEKKPCENGIDYIDRVSDFRIRTIEGALPPTCKLVEEEVTIPAMPEQKVKKMVLKCAKTEEST